MSEEIGNPDTKRFIDLMDAATKDFGFTKQAHERALFFLLKRHANELPDVTQKDGFQKMFRQCDITDSGATDMAIWHLIGCSEVIWDCLDACKPKRASKKAKAYPPAHSPEQMNGEERDAT